MYFPLLFNRSFKSIGGGCFLFLLLLSGGASLPILSIIFETISSIVIFSFFQIMDPYGILNLMIAFDVLMNFFFHLIHLQKFCGQTNVLCRINHRFNHFESKLSRVDYWARSIYESSDRCKSSLALDASKKETIDSSTGGS